MYTKSQKLVNFEFGITMKIIIISFMHLDELPPVISLLKVLSNKFDVLYLGVDDYNNVYKKLFNDKVRFINVLPKINLNIINFWPRLKNALYRRIRKFYLKRSNRFILTNCNSDDLLWVQHEITLEYLKNLDIPYYFTMYELPKFLFQDNSKLKNKVKKSKKIIVPDYCRASIVQACLGLQNLPFILPNKPYEFELETTDSKKSIIEKIFEKEKTAGRRIVLYSGIFLRERKLEPFIDAINLMKDRFTLFLIGRKSEYLEELLNKYQNVKYLGFYTPPCHLSIIKKADIGILTYVADSGSINPVFCAPNKIWEYTKFGLPVLCNDIPGLKYSVEMNHFGYCCDINSTASICNYLDLIDKNYNQLSFNAKQYYSSIDINKIVDNILK